MPSSIAATVRYLGQWAHEPSQYVRVTPVDQQGFVVASTDPRLPPRQADQKWWRDAMRAVPSSYYLSNLAHEPLANDAVFHIAVPIIDDAQSSPIGAIDLVIRDTLLTHMILPIRISNTGHGMLLDTQGTLLICLVLPPTAHLIPRIAEPAYLGPSPVAGCRG